VRRRIAACPSTHIEAHDGALDDETLDPRRFHIDRPTEPDHEARAGGGTMSRARTAHHVLLVGALLYLTPLGCTPPSASSRPRPSKQLYLITPMEIEAEGSRYATAYDLVKSLRPSMLLTRSAPTPRPAPGVPWQSRGVRVVLDGLDFGNIESLTTISAQTVLEIRFLSPIDATTRYGTGHMDGAIVITSRSARR
jgi:hypothetical protein